MSHPVANSASGSSIFFPNHLSPQESERLVFFKSVTYLSPRVEYVEADCWTGLFISFEVNSAHVTKYVFFREIPE